MRRPRLKKLANLLTKIPVITTGEIPEVKIRAVSSDSRNIQPGDAFLAIKGASFDGFDYIPSAIERGAALIISNRPAPKGLSLPYLQIDDDPRKALAWLAAATQNFPARKLRMIGVTGTDGKTSTASMIHHILTQAGVNAGMISTVNALIGDQEIDTGFHVTTPDSPEIQAYLAEMVRAGMTHCILESTSHGLAQGRAIASEFDIAVVTNVTHEHLDYHGDWQHYLEAKGLLFESLWVTSRKNIGNPRLAVLNKDDRSYGYLKRVSPPGYVSYSRLNEADLWAENIVNTPTQLSFDCHIGEQVFQVKSPMIGIYNVSNILAALATCVSGMGMPAETAIAALATQKTVPGRMERIDLGQDFVAMVDFAHTPFAMAESLDTARTLTQGRVIAVFGSAGLRDREKRKMMPKEAIMRANMTILTAEDPRTESLDDILQDMAEAAISAGGVEGENFLRVPDRGDAIRKAIALAKPGDLVVSLGKGHEQSMCFITTEYDWDDRTAMRAALAEHLGVEGPKMPWLPTSER
ncbi:MAG: UDP-N-acetylmuramoyl-L-alanyl-D-glutamate--2,6-diaminopimelate ligase [Anaerolineaceae bacterium]|jgi:UDP-N-acetylmuramoyl-L-alanyl-D-glutamate--2,6-diaminopimelate ligase|nr:UDP-N-acetylmuramoyl-L-alanyl-D-glutamate--2,6-diaminopimelate ligase [Anaerolineaceae bacterium]MDD4043669.1 UDP-N-acetylmuramoyl-L-alanyl-D-glutamate--2,6-diaminopimelate ligase [Anaerolineaceae bacterium]MDD4577486.1 UDP-N-acetylmuramoyl-L-alanyl-D-glutamate--2,6-diaminopimelate ligase [Anaerolineaceae bacterium]